MKNTNVILSDIHNIMQAAECLVRDHKGAALMHNAKYYLEKVESIPDYAEEMDIYFNSSGRELTIRALISKASDLSRP